MKRVHLRSLFRAKSRLPRERERVLRRFQKEIGVHFENLPLLDQALTHRSFSEGKREKSNERLEFLGDAVLGQVVSHFLYREFPDKSEGELTALRSQIVSEVALARRAERLSLGHYLALSEGEAATGGRGKASIISDAFEALVGAIYLDQGTDEVRRFLTKQILGEVGYLVTEQEGLNHKSLLQELMQGQRRGRPTYRVRSEEGPEHCKSFEVEVVVEGNVLGRGRGKCKKDAEQMAARQALEAVEQQPPVVRRRAARPLGRG